MALTRAYRLDTLSDTHAFCGNCGTKSHRAESTQSVYEWGPRNWWALQKFPRLSRPHDSWAPRSGPTL